MLSASPVSPLQTPYPIPPYRASMRVLPLPTTHSYLTTPTFLYAGAPHLHRTKGLPLTTFPLSLPINLLTRETALAWCSVFRL